MHLAAGKRGHTRVTPGEPKDSCVCVFRVHFFLDHLPLVVNTDGQHRGGQSVQLADYNYEPNYEVAPRCDAVCLYGVRVSVCVFIFIIPDVIWCVCDDDTRVRQRPQSIVFAPRLYRQQYPPHYDFGVVFFSKIASNLQLASPPLFSIDCNSHVFLSPAPPPLLS